MEAGVYTLSVGADDRQSAHPRDEIYVIATGAATLVVGDGSEPAQVAVSKGSVLFVAAGTAHHFEDINGDLHVVVVFVNGTPDGADPAYAVIAEPGGLPDTGAATRWNQVLTRSDLTAGLYWLPVSGGGDSTQRHTVDEINVVLSGAGPFTVDGEPTDLIAGSIVYVPAGRGHSFDTPDVNMLDLIVFARP
jgi:mannose-6-phosphate isomerase-like protein (cupin superfamily)